MWRVSETTCEYQPDPLGIESKTPRLFWKVQSDGAEQDWYRVLVSGDRERLEQGEGDLFDTGKVYSRRDFYVEYGGVPLVSRQTCYWKVIAGSADAVAESRINVFETAPDPDEWKGTWMSMPVSNQGGTTLYRKKIIVKDKQVRRARAYVCGIGCCEVYCNGIKTDDAVLDPPVTEYAERVLYRTHDLTKLIRAGENAFGVEVAHGWYGAKKVLVQIYIDYADGETEEHHSSVNGGWWVGGSPTVENSFYDGEVYDARIEEKVPKNWAGAEYEPTWDKGWMFTVYSSPPQGKLESAAIEPARVTKTYPAVSLKKRKDKTAVADFGVNIAGWARIRVRGARGARVTVEYGERLKEDGSVNRCNLRSAKARDVYILKGEGEEEYAPRFTYHGFQYAQIVTEGDCELLSIVAEHVHTDVRMAGAFRCSDETLEKLHGMAVVTELNNQQGILTDCPQRDERFGWLNDLCSRLYQTVYNCGMERFFPKFVRDITHTQQKDGAIADTAPYYTGGRPADPVCVAYLLMPYWSYVYYGDSRTALSEYDGLKGWTDYLLSHSENYIMQYSYYADWVAPDCFGPRTDNLYVSTLSLYWHLKLMSKIAEIAKKPQDAAEYALHAEKCAAAILEKYFDEESGNFAGGTQTANAMALSLGIVPEKCRKKVADNLAAEVERLGDHSSCGNIGYRHLFYALADNGYADLVVKVLKNPEYPGWGYMLANGATSVWERWESEMSDEMDSFDHPMFGSYDAFFYHYLAGIRVEDDAFGCDRIRLQPVFAEGLDHAEGVFSTVRGDIVSRWERKNGRICCHFEIPATVTAKIDLGGLQTECTGGVHDFVVVADGNCAKAERGAPAFAGCGVG